MTQQPLTPAEIRLAQYGQRTSTWSTATYNDGTEKALHEIALGLKAEVDKLRTELLTAQADTLGEVATELEGIDFHPNAKSSSSDLCRLLAGRFRRKALRVLDDVRSSAAEDTLPAWLHQRFGTRGQHAQTWDALTDGDRDYWKHEAAAVRRAVARGGFKTGTAAVSAATRP